MNKIIKVWVDLLCSRCYRAIEIETPLADYERKLKEEHGTEYCEDCKEFVFPIIITKQEYVNPKTLKRDIPHGIEIIAIDGIGIIENKE